MESDHKVQVFEKSDSSASTNGEPAAGRQRVDLIGGFVETRRPLKKESSVLSAGTHRSVHIVRSRGSAERSGSESDESPLDVTLTPQQGHDANISLSTLDVSCAKPGVGKPNASSHLPDEVSEGCSNRDKTINDVPSTSSATCSVFYFSSNDNQVASAVSDAHKVDTQSTMDQDRAKMSAPFSDAIVSNVVNNAQELDVSSIVLHEVNDIISNETDVTKEKSIEEDSCSRANSRDNSTSLSNSSISKRESGADADVDDTDGTGYSSTSIDIIDAADQAVEAIKTERKREEEVLNIIANNLQVISSEIFAIRIAAADVFGTRGKANGKGLECDIDGSKTSENVKVEEDEAPAQIACSYNRRLNALKDYVSSAYTNIQEKMYKELNAFQPMDEVNNPQCSELTIDQETVEITTTPSAETSTSTCNVRKKSKQKRVNSGRSVGGAVLSPDVDKQRWLKDVCRAARYKRKKILRQYGTLSALCTVSKYHISKMELSCQTALSCTTSMVNMLNPVLEARQFVIKAVEKETDSKEVIGGCSTAFDVIDASDSVSKLLHDALDAAEGAAKNHGTISKSLEQAEKSLQDMQYIEHISGSYVEGIVAAVDKLEKAASSEVDVNVDQIKSKLRTVDMAAVPTSDAIVEALRLRNRVWESAIGADEETNEAVDALYKTMNRAIDAIETALEVLKHLSVKSKKP